jgi:predicted amidohydrolase
MTKARIMGVQIQPEISNKQANLDKVQKYIEDNKWFNPDLVVLPEVFTSGLDHKALHKCAENIPNGETSEFFSNLAKKYNTNIVAGSFIEKCEKFNPPYSNTMLVFNRTGEIIGKYRKIHMFDYYGSNESDYVSSGDKAVVVETDIGKIGLSICYDLRFPELYRTLTYAGAEILICAAAWPYPRLEHWTTLNKARAIENTAYVVAVNQCGKSNIKRQHLGMSMIVNPWGDITACAGGDEGVMFGEIDFEYLRKIRQEFPVLNDRNLDAYCI